MTVAIEYSAVSLPGVHHRRNQRMPPRRDDRNPPFVTARNPAKRELYRERWPGVCHQKFHLLCPFVEASFLLLREAGQLGFIVSNAFTKREFGEPLVDNFLRSIDLRQVIDCSGLMFPGHGTPTCILFASNNEATDLPIRMVMTLPGGGDLRTAPEDSPLWNTIAAQARHPAPIALNTQDSARGFRLVFEDFRIATGDCVRKRILTHPCMWSFYDWPTVDKLTADHRHRLRDILDDDLGVCTMTNCDDVLVLQGSELRRLVREVVHAKQFQEADMQRDWNTDPGLYAVFPYDKQGAVIPPTALSRKTLGYLEHYRGELEERKSFGNKTFKQLGRVWYEHERMNKTKYAHAYVISWALVATHVHALPNSTADRLFKQTNTVATLANSTPTCLALVTGLMNSSAVLFWAKQICFSRREAEESTTDTYYEFAGVKIQDLPTPNLVVAHLNGISSPVCLAITAHAEADWALGTKQTTLATDRLFTRTEEAYASWNSSLPGYVPPNPKIGKPFATADELRATVKRVIELRESLRAEMIARQEEMDWLVYAAYGLIAQTPEELPDADLTLAREERPFCLWAAADGDFDKAVQLIPPGWSEAKKKVWRRRLEIIRDNEHVRRIEQPVYKRRWDEQWKVGNRWVCGQPAYDAEFLDAFEWWLSEKAEWWLEHQHKGKPVDLDAWAEALWSDERVQAAWTVAAGTGHRLETWKRQQSDKPKTHTPGPSPKRRGGKEGLDASRVAFTKTFRKLVKDQSVPENIPYAVEWEKLEKKMAVPAAVKKIRGKLNVPRERFRVNAEGMYVVAGL